MRARGLRGCFRGGVWGWLEPVEERDTQGATDEPEDAREEPSTCERERQDGDDPQGDEGAIGDGRVLRVCVEVHKVCADGDDNEADDEPGKGSKDRVEHDQDDEGGDARHEHRPKRVFGCTAEGSFGGHRVLSRYVRT